MLSNEPIAFEHQKNAKLIMNNAMLWPFRGQKQRHKAEIELKKLEKNISSIIYYERVNSETV